MKNLVLLAGLAGLFACSTPREDAVEMPAIVCTCGQPDADFEGCLDPLCVSGAGNPDNPDCVCGRLSIED